MKAYHLILLLFLTISSCSKNKSLAKDLQGSWIKTELVIDEIVDKNPSGKGTIITFFEYKKDNGEIKFEFKNIAVDDYESNGTYSISNKGKTISISAGGLTNVIDVTTVENELHFYKNVSGQKITNIYLKQ